MKMKLNLILFFLISSAAIAQWTDCGTLYDGGKIYSLAFNGNTLIAGSWGGGIFTTDDNAQTWKRITPEQWYLCIKSIYADDEVAIAGSYNCALHTKDKFKNYVMGCLGQSNLTFNSIIKFKNSYITATSGGLFVTESMSNWTLINNHTNDFSAWTVASLDDRLFCGTAGEGVLISDDAGNTWVPSNDGMTETNVYCLLVNGNDIWAGTLGGGVFLSTDRGQSWKPKNAGLNTKSIWSIAVYGRNVIVGTYGGGIYVSKDYGMLWETMNKGLSDYLVESLACKNDYIFAGTSSGKVFKASFSDLKISDVENIESVSTFSSISPNPATDFIEISIPANNHTLKGVVEDIRIYNVLGEAVLNPNNSQFSIFNSQLKIDVSALPSGVYFVRVEDKVMKFLKM